MATKNHQPLTFTLTKEVEQTLDNMRKKLDIDIIKDNHMNSVNRDNLIVCSDYLHRSTPTKEFKYEKFRQ